VTHCLLEDSVHERLVLAGSASALTPEPTA
jgi:hypothetical protein